MSVLKLLIYESLNQHCYKMCGEERNLKMELQCGETCETPPSRKNVNVGIGTLIMLVMDFVSSEHCF